MDSKMRLKKENKVLSNLVKRKDWIIANRTDERDRLKRELVGARMRIAELEKAFMEVGETDLKSDILVDLNEYTQIRLENTQFASENKELKAQLHEERYMSAEIAKHRDELVVRLGQLEATTFPDVDFKRDIIVENAKLREENQRLNERASELEAITKEAQDRHAYLYAENLNLEMKLTNRGVRIRELEEDQRTKELWIENLRTANVVPQAKQHPTSAEELLAIRQECEKMQSRMVELEDRILDIKLSTTLPNS